MFKYYFYKLTKLCEDVSFVDLFSCKLCASLGGDRIYTGPLLDLLDRTRTVAQAESRTRTRRGPVPGTRIALPTERPAAARARAPVFWAGKLHVTSQGGSKVSVALTTTIPGESSTSQLRENTFSIPEFSISPPLSQSFPHRLLQIAEQQQPARRRRSQPSRSKRSTRQCRQNQIVSKVNLPYSPSQPK